MDSVNHMSSDVEAEINVLQRVSCAITNEIASMVAMKSDVVITESIYVYLDESIVCGNSNFLVIE